MSVEIASAVVEIKVAPTGADILKALEIRDEIAHKINRINRSTSRGEKVTVEHAKLVAERLIELGYVDVAAVHSALANDDDDDDEVDDDDL